MQDQPWHEDVLDDAASTVARRFEIDDEHARELVGQVADALEEGGDAVGDAGWDVQQEYPDVDGEEFVEDVATSLGYDDIW
ncbi:hypothetical protein [Amycolatopsis samaneae]|uniref:Uncharacterized protein n=1 Tax=Amycolatopsis samaneae TaxID=664691 RepID=A0ABW5GKF4_9PSEU